MPITLDGATSSGTEPWNHTIGSGDNRILIVGVYDNNNTVSPQTKYNGVEMTFIDSAQNGNDVINLFYLINPPVGAHNIDVTIGGTAFVAGFSVSYFGARQSGQPDNFTNHAEVNTHHDSDLTPTIPGCILVGLVYAGVAVSAGANTNARATVSGLGLYDNIGFPNSTILKYTAGSSTQWESVIASIASTDVAGGAALMKILTQL